MIFASIDSERYVKKTEGISGESFFNKKNKKKYLVGDNYADATLTFDVEIVTMEERELPLNERREIERWLFNRYDFGKLYVAEEDDVENESTEIINGLKYRTYLNCRFMNPSKIEHDGGIIGYRATMETDSPFAWQDKMVDNINSTGIERKIIKTDTDMDDYIYPLIQISGSTSWLEIKNLTDDPNRSIKFEDLQGQTTTIEIDCSTGYLNVNGSESYNNLTKWKLPRLLKGDNEFEISCGGNVHCEFIWQNRRMI